MNADCFVDTNILVYAADSGHANKAKHEVALALLKSSEFGLSVQVLQEFYLVVTRKLERSLNAQQALEFIERFEAFPVVITDMALFTVAVSYSERFQLSYWDGAIIAAAERLHASVLYSEDLNHRQRYGSVEVRNPFRT